jgi:hypothetical protein
MGGGKQIGDGYGVRKIGMLIDFIGGRYHFFPKNFASILQYLLQAINIHRI